MPERDLATLETLRVRLDTLEESLAQHRDLLVDLKESRLEMANMLQSLAKSHGGVKGQVADCIRQQKEIQERFESATIELTQSTSKATVDNIEVLKAIQRALAELIGNKFLSAAQYLIGTAILSSVGYFWYHYISGTHG